MDGSQSAEDFGKGIPAHEHPEPEHVDDRHAPDEEPFFIAGVGASAGGLEALERLFDEMPRDLGVAFVVVQHLSPDFKSMMDELLARRTKIPIVPVQHGMRVAPDHIYLMPAKKEMIIAGGRLLLTDKDPQQRLTLPIDHFFRSLAHDAGRHAIGIVLSGTGSDGSRGIQDIHHRGGLVLVQSPDSAKFDGMPRRAEDTGLADAILRPEEMAPALTRFVQHKLRGEVTSEADAAKGDDSLGKVFRLLRAAYGIDFSHYKPTTVGRRIERRLLLNHSIDIDDYVDRLERDESELNSLYHDLLIGVTRFFRDAKAFELLESEVLPDLVANLPPHQELRCWVAGCATGEEAYSLAILLHEEFERQQRPLAAKIFATDMHRASLDAASAGLFGKDSIAEMSGTRVAKFFDREEDGVYRATQQLRQSIVFAPHNVLKDAPFTRLDLISCRNLLIYLRPPAQQKVLSHFHFGLKLRGVLILGPSESPGALSDEFDTLHDHWRIYRKRRNIRLPDDLQSATSPATGAIGRVSAPTVPAAHSPDRHIADIYDELLQEYMPPSLLVDEHRELVHSFGGANQFLRFPDGRPSNDVLDLLDQDARLAVAGALQRSVRQNSAVKLSGVCVGGEVARLVNLSVTPFRHPTTGDTLRLIRFDPMPRQPATPAEQPPGPVSDMERLSREQVATLENELRYTKENLQAAIEELEASNEELQAANEELIASYEELQSTNEELQSVNEELYTVNAEYQKKIAELTELTSDMDHLLASTGAPTIFVDRELMIRKFTPKIEETFNLLPQDVGRRIDSFSHSLDAHDLLGKCRQVCETGQPIEGEVKDHKGTKYFLRLHPYVPKHEVEGVVITLIDISTLKQAEAELARYRDIVRSSEDAILGFDIAGRITNWNPAAERVFGYTAEEILGQPLKILAPPDKHKEVEHILNSVSRGEPIRQLETRRLQKDGQEVLVSLTVSPIFDADGEFVGGSAIERNITKRKRIEAALRESEQRYYDLYDNAPDMYISFDAETGVVSDCNQTLLDRLGYQREEVIDKPVLRLYAPEARAQAEGAFREFQQTGEIRDQLLMLLTASGDRVHVSLSVTSVRDDEGKIIRSRSVWRDITKQVEAQEAGRRSEDRTRKIVESALDGIISIDENGHTIGWNPQAEAIFGWTAEEAIGRPLPELIIPREQREAFWRGLKKYLETGQGPMLEGRMQLEATGRDSQRVPVELTVTAQRNGESIELTGFVRDITDRIRAETEWRQEIERRDRFLAMLSHELRNPLGAVLNAAEVLKQDGNAAGADAARSVVQRQTQQLGRLLDDLLDVSRIVQNKLSISRRVFDLRDTVEGVREVIQPLTNRKRQTLTPQICTDPLPVFGDPARLTQIQQNLLRNASKYTTREGRIDWVLERDGDRARIRVRDDGIGIASHLVDRVFEPFVQDDKTLDRSGGGMGLGLTLVKALVEQHEGNVSVRTEGLGKGAEFIVELPLAEKSELAHSQARRDAAALQPAELTQRLILVEDNDDAREMLETFLIMEGVDVESFADGESGVAAILEQQPPIAVVDIGLPRLDGYQVARRVREKLGAKVFLVALTGYGQAEDRRRVFDAGFDRHLIKPVKPAVLLQTLAMRG